MGSLMRSMRRRYILFKFSCNFREGHIISLLRDRFELPHFKIVYRKDPFIIIRVDHLVWESLKRMYGPRLKIISGELELESLMTSGTIRKAREKIKDLETISSHGDEEAVPVKSEGKDVE